MKIFGLEIGKKKEVEEENKELNIEEFRKIQLMNLRLNSVADLNKLTVDKDGICDQAKAVKTILDMELDVERLEMERKQKEAEQKQAFWKTVTVVVVGGVTVLTTLLEYKLTKDYANNVWSEQAMDKIVQPKLSQTYVKLNDGFRRDVNNLSNKTFNLR